MLELLARAPDPARAAKLTRAQVSAALKRARRRGIADKTDVVLAALRGEHLGQPPALTAAYAATVRSLVAVITTLNEQVKVLKEQVREHFGRHPDAEIYRSQPGMAAILGARVRGESGDDPSRYADAKSRKNYGGTSPITRASGKKKVVAARFIHNDRLIDAFMGLGLRIAERLARRPHVLRPAARQGTRAQRRSQAPGEPAGRHSPRLPEDPHPLRRGHSLGAPGKPPPIFRRGLTFKLLGCLSLRACGLPAHGLPMIFLVWLRCPG